MEEKNKRYSKRERERDNGNVIDENDDSNVSELQKYVYVVTEIQLHYFTGGYVVEIEMFGEL